MIRIPEGKTERAWDLRSIAELLHKHWIILYLKWNLKIVQWPLKMLLTDVSSKFLLYSSSMILINK